MAQTSLHATASFHSWGSSVHIYLFGTVNEEQLQDIKRLTQESIARSKGIVHSVNSLLSLVNNTQDVIENNQTHIHALNRRMVAMRTEFDKDKSILHGDRLRYRMEQ